MTLTDEFLIVAKKSAIEAGKILLERFGKTHQIKYKSEKDIVTEADLEAEKTIISIIREKYPDHNFYGEESGKSNTNSEYVWIIDPLDGTNNYAYGLPLFGLSIALYKNNKPVLGVISIPLENEVYYAVKGGGAFLNDKKVTVSDRKELKYLMTFFHWGRITEDVTIKMEELNKQLFHIRNLGAATIHFSHIIKGTADVWFDYKSVMPYDIAAGCLIVEEAGGKVTDFDGNPWTIETKKLLVTNGNAHDEIVLFLKERHE